MSQFIVIKYLLQCHYQFQIKGYIHVPQKTCSTDPVVHLFKHQIIKRMQSQLINLYIIQMQRISDIVMLREIQNGNADCLS